MARAAPLVGWLRGSWSLPVPPSKRGRRPQRASFKMYSGPAAHPRAEARVHGGASSLYLNCYRACTPAFRLLPRLRIRSGGQEGLLGGDVASGSILKGRALLHHARPVHGPGKNRQYTYARGPSASEHTFAKAQVAQRVRALTQLFRISSLRRPSPSTLLPPLSTPLVSWLKPGDTAGG